MSFLTPLYLAGAALIAIPIVLHLLRRDVAPPLAFTAVSLLRKTTVDRSRRHRLRDLLLLAARICALLLLAGSFARPYLAGRSPGALDFLAAVVSKWAGTRAHLAESRPQFLETILRVESHAWVAPVFRAHWGA